MGRPVKLTDRDKSWTFRRPAPKRLINTREERQRFLIVCEGEKTEPNYFEAFKQELPKDLVQLDIHGEGRNTLSLVARAQELKKRGASGDHPFDQVWIVFDRDSFEAADFDNAINKAAATKIRCAWSNESFELWYILHFENRKTGMERTEYKDKLSQLLGEPYQKNARDVYQQLMRLGDQAQAVKWAKQLHDNFRASKTPPSRSNPCTTVFQLVEELNRFKITGGN